MALEAIINREGIYRVVLEERPEGVYVYVFNSEDPNRPFKDHLQDNWQLAKLAALQDYEITDVMWTEIPDTRLHG